MAKKLGIKDTVVSFSPTDNTYKVHAGLFTNINNAKAYARRIKSKGFSPIIVTHKQ